MNNEGLTNTPLINYFRYKQSTFVSGNNTAAVCDPITFISDGGNGQLVVSTPDTSLLDVGVAITITSTTNYNGNYTVISKTPITFNISGEFVGTETGTWELASNITGANAGDPLDFGVITFFDNSDQVTLQDTFQDRDLTIPNPNPITLDAVGSYPVIYMIDNPYYIVIRDKFNNLVATLENYLPTASNDLPDFDTDTENLFSNYGFETVITNDLAQDQPAETTSGTFVSPGWVWNVQTVQTDNFNTYNYTVVSDLGLEGNPKNELILKTTNTLTAKTVNSLQHVLGDYNKFQNAQLVLSLYNEVLNGSVNTLDVHLVRSRNGVLETPINVGTIPIGATLTQQTLVFTVPPLVDANYSNNDFIRLDILLPLNEDFDYGFTATWLQISASGVPVISEHAGQEDASKLFFNHSFRDQNSGSQWEFRGLPTTIGRNGVETMNQTGSIFLAATVNVQEYNYALTMEPYGGEGNGSELIRDQQKSFSITNDNRLLDFLQLNGLGRSRYDLLLTTPVVSNVVSLTLGVGATEVTPWTATAGGRVTVVKTATEFATGVEARAIGNGRLNFTFINDFAATTTLVNPQYSVAGGNLFWPPTLQVSPILTQLGSFDFLDDVRSENALNGQPPTGIISGGGGGTPAKVVITFPDVSRTLFPLDKRGAPLGLFGTALPGTYNGDFRTESYYQGHLDNTTADPLGVFRAWFDFGGGVQHQVANIPWGYISFNDIANNPNPQPFPPPHLIRFSLDGIAPPASLVGSITTTTVALTSDMNAAEVAAAVSQAVNNGPIYDVTIVAIPQNGDYITVSNVASTFDVVYWDTAQTRPPAPGTNFTFYVEFTTGDTLLQIAAATGNIVEGMVKGVPRAADLGMTFPFLNNRLSYYMSM